MRLGVYAIPSVSRQSRQRSFLWKGSITSTYLRSINSLNKSERKAVGVLLVGTGLFSVWCIVKLTGAIQSVRWLVTGARPTYSLRSASLSLYIWGGRRWCIVAQSTTAAASCRSAYTSVIEAYRQSLGTFAVESMRVMCSSKRLLVKVIEIAEEETFSSSFSDCESWRTWNYSTISLKCQSRWVRARLKAILTEVLSFVLVRCWHFAFAKD